MRHLGMKPRTIEVHGATERERSGPVAQVRERLTG